MKVDRYSEIFAIEIEGWCYGIEHYPGEVHPALVHRIIKELGESFRMAISHGVEFNVIELAGKISKAAKYLLPERDVALSVLSQLPCPTGLNEQETQTLHAIVLNVDSVYPGTLQRLQRKWELAKAA